MVSNTKLKNTSFVGFLTVKLLGMNFAGIACISYRKRYSWKVLHLLQAAWREPCGGTCGPFLGSCGLQMSARASLCACGWVWWSTGCQSSFWELYGMDNEDSLKDSVCGIFTSLVVIQNSQRPTVALSSQQTEGAGQILHMTTAWFRIPAHKLYLAGWGLETCVAQRAGGIASSGPSEVSVSHQTASSSTAPGCICTCPSWLTWWLLPVEGELIFG